MKTKYDPKWSGIDAGREGLWREPIWTRVLEIIAAHELEKVYDEDSSIYPALEGAFPNETWRSHTREGHFRPLFRDYPNPWTRTGIVSLKNQEFKVTNLGRLLLSAKITKQEIFLSMFTKHRSDGERPFQILSNAFLQAPRPLSTKEIYWHIMRNWRPGLDDLTEVLRHPLTPDSDDIPGTPKRRLRNILALLRAVDAIKSHLRNGETWWAKNDSGMLNKIAQAKGN